MADDFSPPTPLAAANTPLKSKSGSNVLASLLALSMVASPAMAQTYPPSGNSGGNAPPQDQYAPPQGQYAPPQGQYAPPPGQNSPPPGQYAPPQGQYAPPPGQYPPPPPGGDNGPPPGQYAPPPVDAEAPGSVYDDRAQRYDRDYADRYAQWAARYCVDRRRNNTAAGAVIGGVLGALLGSGIAGRGSHAAGAIVGGAVGATAGAAVGANSRPDTACPPGYNIAAGAPAFAYGPDYPDAVIYGPAWYRPWVWVGGRWVYRPYRYWYWTHDAYWRPGWRARPWSYHYRRW